MNIRKKVFCKSMHFGENTGRGICMANAGAFDRRYDIYAGLALCILTVSACWFLCLRHGIFGSKVDWISQHSVLPDYFRRQFYETGNLFPEFAANIGGGQNVYNFSYYGLYSPVILLSYLLPFVKMADYMMAAQIAGLMVSVVLLYRWLFGRGFERKICFFTAVIFLLSGPMVYQSYNQIMFVNYMPFLCLGFLGVDRYFEKRKSGLLNISVFLLIMTSFYFSIGGMLALSLYGLHRYIGECEAKQQEFFGIQKRRAAAFLFFREGVNFLTPFFIAALMSGVLLIPTAAALMGRRGGSEGTETKIASLLAPDISIGRFFYSPYGIGLTTFAVTALLSMMFFQRWQERVLAWGCVIVLTVPLFAYVLNGGLYVRDKVMIPFLPLLCYVMAYYVDSISGPGEKQEKEGKTKKGRNVFTGALPFAALLCILLIHFNRSGWGRWGKLLLADAVIMLLCYVLFCIRKNVFLLLIPPVLFLALSGYAYNSQKSSYVSREFYEEVTDEETARIIKETVEAEEGFYRTEQLGTQEENAANLNRIWDLGQYVTSIYSSLYNGDYQQFRKDFGAGQPYRNYLMQPALSNPVYQRFMGVKYVVERGKLRENQLASPVAYATDKVMAENEYKRLKFPENQLALLDYAVVKKDTAGGKETVRKNMNEKREIQSVIPVCVILPEETDSVKKKTVSIDIPQNTVFAGEENGSAEWVLFLRFSVENLRPSKDVAVWLEEARNKLTAQEHFYYNANTVFTYAVPIEKNKRQVKLVFGAGHYRISDTECFLGLLPTEKEAESLYQSGLVLDKDRTKGNVIAGSVTAKREGYFITAIPYDKNFKLLIDGKYMKIEKVNTAFLGCRIPKGRHKVNIIYSSPGAAEGKMVSVLGILLFYVDFRNRRIGDASRLRLTGKCG